MRNSCLFVAIQLLICCHILFLLKVGRICCIQSVQEIASQIDLFLSAHMLVYLKTPCSVCSVQILPQIPTQWILTLSIADMWLRLGNISFQEWSALLLALQTIFVSQLSLFIQVAFRISWLQIDGFWIDCGIEH